MESDGQDGPPGPVRSEFVRDDRWRVTMAEVELPIDTAAQSPTIPAALRSFVREGEIGLVLLAAVIGVIAGLAVVAMEAALQELHALIFGADARESLSTAAGLSPMTVLLGPALGGLAFGIVSWLIFRKRSQPVDPIEANALFGGRMSLGDSLIVAAQTVASSGVGASVGLEAGYTQAASGIASWIGSGFRLRRADLRLLVGCGAGAAIGAAFNAPLAGAFYAFELILGTYSIVSFAPVLTATFTATLTREALFEMNLLGSFQTDTTVTAGDFPLLILLGAVCGVIGIAIMQGATLLERAFRRVGVPAFLRPAIGGLAVGGLALWATAVLSAGHGAIEVFLTADDSLLFLASALAAKALASAISIGSGFRGGLFHASLLLGVLAGRVFAATVALVVPGLTPDAWLYALAGMSALAVSVVGGPMTMSFIALEMTGDLRLTFAVLAAVATASLLTRRLFGYSFATWRLHLRGENIKSANDIGWIRDLTVGKIMRLEIPKIDANATISEAILKYPPGSTSYLVAVHADNSYAGMIPPVLLYAPQPAGDAKEDYRPTVGSLLRNTDDMLLPTMTASDAMLLFEQTETEALAVVDSPGKRTVVGVLSEAHAVKRYSDEVGRRMRELTGDER